MSAPDSSPSEQASAPRPTRIRTRGNQIQAAAKQSAVAERREHGYRSRPRQQDDSRAYGQKGRASWRRQKQKQEAAAPNQKAYVPVGEPQPVSGLLEITPKGFGFIRIPDNNWAPSEDAIYVSAELIRKHSLRPFVQISGMAQRYERGHQLITLNQVNGQTPEEAANNPHFEDLKAVNPTHRLAFETESSRYTTRTLDLIAPVARGQRGLIVAPPRTGKTTLLMHIAEGAMENYGDDLHLMILLVDERPEEVTEFKRALPGAEIYASSNDSGVREHCRMAELCIERAKRLVEAGRHVLILMDSITRLARAYNNADRGLSLIHI